MQVNLPAQEEFFSFEASDLKMRVDGCLLHYYLATLDLVAPLMSFNEVHSLTNTCNVIEYKNDMQDLIEELNQEVILQSDVSSTSKTSTAN